LIASQGREYPHGLKERTRFRLGRAGHRCPFRFSVKRVLTLDDPSTQKGQKP